MHKKIQLLLFALMTAITVGCSSNTSNNDSSQNASHKSTTKETETVKESENNQENTKTYDFATVPDYNDVNQPTVTLSNNVPNFSDEEKNKTTSEIQLSELDSLGRCGKAFEVIGKDILPSEERKDISSIYPTGWHQEKYGSTYVYNRSHLLAFC